MIPVSQLSLSEGLTRIGRWACPNHVMVEKSPVCEWCWARKWARDTLLALTGKPGVVAVPVAAVEGQRLTETDERTIATGLCKGEKAKGMFS